jgi:SAM-dependent methyltransferase
VSRLTDLIDRKLYPGVGSNWDDELLRESVLRRLKPEMCVLDLGAGRGLVAQMAFRGLARRVVGVDLDPRVGSNPNLDEGIVASATQLPFPASSFDLVVCDNVLEHVDEPARVMSEVARVLRPGGRFLAKTPNRKHYMPLISRMTPTSFHRWVNRLRGRNESDTFRTQYRINTPRDVELHARSCGLEVEKIRLIEGRPEYLRIAAVTYLVGAVYERLVNSTDMLARFRISMLIELRKPGA